MSENINVFGLQSFTDPNEAWKIMSCDFGSYEINLQILNDKFFVKAVMEQIIIRVVDYKTGRISREELEFSLGVNSEAMDTYMVNFNFFLYSQKNKKFYTSIVETDNGSCSGALSEDEKALFNELCDMIRVCNLNNKELIELVLNLPYNMAYAVLAKNKNGRENIISEYREQLFQEFF